MALRSLESRLHAVTGGNGAIYAVRPDAYLRVDAVMGHDLAVPVRDRQARQPRAVYVPEARATEKMVPSIEGEWARKRRMMSHAWPIVLRAGMLDPARVSAALRAHDPSHRVLRYAAPFLHVVLLAVEPPARARVPGGSSARCSRAQLLLLAGAAAGGRVRMRPLLVARYYVLTQASIAMGLWDWLRHGTPAGWSAPEGTR